MSTLLAILLTAASLSQPSFEALPEAIGSVNCPAPPRTISTVEGRTYECRPEEGADPYQDVTPPDEKAHWLLPFGNANLPPNGTASYHAVPDDGGAHLRNPDVAHRKCLLPAATCRKKADEQYRGCTYRPARAICLRGGGRHAVSGAGRKPCELLVGGGGISNSNRNIHQRALCRGLQDPALEGGGLRHVPASGGPGSASGKMASASRERPPP